MLPLSDTVTLLPCFFVTLLPCYFVILLFCHLEIIKKEPLNHSSFIKINEKVYVSVEKPSSELSL